MTKRVLIVEDNELVSETLKSMLEFFQIEVTVAPSGAEAIKLFEVAKNSNEPFDIVFIDLVLPMMHGSDVLKELQKIDPEVKAVISSGYSDDPSISHYEKLGFNGILNKPYTLDELRDVLVKLKIL